MRAIPRLLLFIFINPLRSQCNEVLLGVIILQLKLTRRNRCENLVVNCFVALKYCLNIEVASCCLMTYMLLVTIVFGCVDLCLIFLFCFVRIVCLSPEGVTSHRVLAYDLMILRDDGGKRDCHQTSKTL